MSQLRRFPVRAAGGPDIERPLGGSLIDPIIMLVALAWATFAFAARVFARHRDRPGLVWFLFGSILGPVALLILWVAPPGRCRSCGTRTRGWLRICTWCREDVRVMPAATSEMLARLSRTTTAAPSETKSSKRRRAGPPGGGVDAPAKPAANATSHVGQSAGSRAPANPAIREVIDSAGVSRTRTPPRGAGEWGMATRVLATAVYVAGTTRLEPGSRYSIAVRGSRLLLLGPTDVDPTTVILDRPVTQIDATAVEGRLVLSEPQNRSGPVMAFMSIAGPSTTELARMIHHAAGGAVEP